MGKIKFSARKKKGSNMYREIVIVVIILITIFLGNYLTQANTVKSVTIMSEELRSLKEILLQEKEKQDLEKQMEQIMEKWDKLDHSLAFYIEHNELEKVETELTNLRANIEVEEYKEGIAGLERGIYLLTHIKEKQAFNLVNIF